MRPSPVPNLGLSALFRRPFWLLNLVLLLLFGWTLSEQTRLRIDVRDGRCTAVLPERSVEVACLGLDRTEVGLYSLQASTVPLWLTRPWEVVMPSDSWGAVRAWRPDGPTLWQATFDDGLGWLAAGGDWRIRAGEAQNRGASGLLVYQEIVRGNFSLEAQIRRAEDGAGILLQSPDGSSGWLFLVSGKERRGVWWSWQDGQAAEPLVGAPFQKPFLTQLQDLLRLVLKSHQAALALLLLTAGFGALSGRMRPRSEGGKLALLFGRPILAERFMVVAATLLVFGLSLHVAVRLLEGIPHVQDSITYLFQAQTLAEGRLWAPAPAQPEFFEQEFLLVRDGRWFGKYPPGFPAMLAAGVRLGAPWLINPLLAALTVPLVAVLGRRLYGRAITGPAMILLAFSPFVLGLSGSLMAHAAELFWITLFLVAWSRALALDRGRQTQAGAGRGRLSMRWAAVAGISLGFGLLIRQPAALLMGAGFGGATILLYGQTLAPRQRRLALALASAGIGLAALVLLGYQYTLTGNALQDPRLLFWSYDSVGFGRDLGQGENAFRYESAGGETVVAWYQDPDQPPRGHTPQRGLFNLQQNWQALVGQLFGWLVFISPAPRRADLALLAAAAGLMAFQVFYWADGIMYGPRYLYAALPAFVLLTARGFLRLAQFSGQRVAGLLLLVLVGGNLIFFLPGQFDEWQGYNFVDRSALDLAGAEAVPPAIVFVDPGAGDWWEYGRVFSGNTPWLDGPIVYARDLGQAENLQLLASMPERRGYLLLPGGLQPIPDN